MECIWSFAPAYGIPPDRVETAQRTDDRFTHCRKDGLGGVRQPVMNPEAIATCTHQAGAP